GGQTAGITDNTVSGDIIALAAQPGNANVLYAATANGGVWRTVNAGTVDANNPHWVPLTDSAKSLATSSIAISPLDDTGAAVTGATPVSKLVVYAGTGSSSAASFVVATDAVGVLKSTDGGTTWSLLGDKDTELAGLRINSIVPTDLLGGQK